MKKPPKRPPVRHSRKTEPGTVIAELRCADDSTITVLLSVVRRKVVSVVFPTDQGGKLTMPASLLRAAVEMIDDVEDGR